ncbi:MAG TPA: discoidin domain-containing protein [Chloroflexota bacterium]|nr:discoidin domain-containing protein [Chloroflexota bacterium]
MLRAHLDETKHCYLHPHRVVATQCARCKTPYCDECLETRDTGLFARIVAKDERNPPPLFCSRCAGEVEALEAMEAERRRPLYQRLRPTRDGLRRAAIWAAVLAVIGVPMSFAVRNMAETTITPEELGRIKLALSGGFLAPEGINFVGEAFQGRFVRATAASQRAHEPTRLLDSWAQPEVPGWRSADGKVPIDLVFELQQVIRFNAIVLKAQPGEPPETWVRDVELHVAGGADGPFTRVYAGRMAPSSELRDNFPDATGRFVLLRVLSTQGNAPYVSLAELELYYAPTIKS